MEFQIKGLNPLLASWDHNFKVEDFSSRSSIERLTGLRHPSKWNSFDPYSFSEKFDQEAYQISKERASLFWRNDSWREEKEEIIKRMTLKKIRESQVLLKEENERFSFLEEREWAKINEKKQAIMQNRKMLAISAFTVILGVSLSYVIYKW